MPNKLSLIPDQKINDLGWNSYGGNPYNETTISKITDNMGRIEVPVTSIPSPFAQIHLFETSFEFVNKTFEDSHRNPALRDPSLLNGSATYHKNISRCLDVFEMLFRFETLKLKDKITMKRWSIEELEKLSEDTNIGMKTFADTIKVFINNYNNDHRFVKQGLADVFDSFLLFFHKNTIIAGTSPYTGFFTVADEIPQTIVNEDNRTFFSDNVPLYQRKEDFQRFMTIFFSTNTFLVESFKAVNTYIINNNTVSEYKDLKSGFNPSQISKFKEKYVPLEINDNEVTFLNDNIIFLCEEYNKEDDEIIAKNSDYVIITSKKLERPPLALSKKGAKARWNYLDGNSFPEDVETTSSVSIQNRQLPGSVIEYPWVNRNDFLSEHLIQLDYKMNTSKFWLPDGDVQNIILPIKPAYFDFFTIEDLKNQLTIERLKLGAVVVTLKIPIVSKKDNGKGTIKFERIYDSVVPETVDNDENGAIVESNLAFGIYPFFKVSNLIYNDRYKALLYHQDSEEINCEFYKESFDEPKSISIKVSSISRTRKEEEYPAVSNYIDISSITYSSQGEIEFKKDSDMSFDIIGVSLKNLDLDTSLGGCIIPLMGEAIKLSKDETSVAFDIGTSNSFVAYEASKASKGVKNLSSYTNKAGKIDPYLVMLNEPREDRELYDKYDISGFNTIFGAVQDAEFMPSIIGDESHFNFPIRSIINIDNDTNTENGGEVNILSNVNIPFAFGQSNLRFTNDFLYSNIKWGVTDSESNAARNKLKAFIEQLVWMGRNKILGEGFTPENANVIWFKPLSMSTNQMTLFESIWEKLYTTYFGKSKDTEKLFSITESWAPYYSYPRDFGFGKVFMNLDIGGGTSDLIVFEDGKPLLTTSFRFAGNSLFESQDKNQPFSNGFVTRYESEMRKYYGDDIRKVDTIDYIKESTGLESTDLVGYFFGFDEFKRKLSMDSEFKLLFLIHNTSIFYHSFQMLKMIKAKTLPSYIGLSGNGAKLLGITNGNKDLNRINGFARLVAFIFQKVFDLSDPHKVELKMLDKPKESTAIGGIDGLKKMRDNKGADIENYYISVGTKNDLINNSNAKERKKFRYVDFLKSENTMVQDITENVLAFFTYFFDELWYDADFVQNFGVDKAYNTDALRIFFTDEEKIRDTIEKTIKEKIEVEKETPLNDTLFFEAIKAYLSAFSKYIVSDRIDQFKGA